MTFAELLFLISFLGSRTVAAKDAFQETTLPPAVTTTLPASDNNNVTFFSPRVEKTQPSLVAPSSAPEVKPSQGSNPDSEHDIASATITATTSNGYIGPIVVTAFTKPHLEVPTGTDVILPPSQPSEEPHPDPQPSHLPVHDSPDPDFVISSLEQLLSTATVTGSELAAHFTSDAPLVEILATARITDPKLSMYLTSAPPYVIGDKTIDVGSTGVVVAGTTYSIAPSGAAEGSVYVNGHPVAETAVPGLREGDSIADTLSEMAFEKGSGSETGRDSRTLEASASSSMTGTPTSSQVGTSTIPTSATPTLQAGGTSAGGALGPRILLFCMLLCGLVIL